MPPKPADKSFGVTLQGVPSDASIPEPPTANTSPYAPSADALPQPLRLARDASFSSMNATMVCPEFCEIWAQSINGPISLSTVRSTFRSLSFSMSSQVSSSVIVGAAGTGGLGAAASSPTGVCLVSVGSAAHANRTASSGASKSLVDQTLSGAFDSAPTTTSQCASIRGSRESIGSATSATGDGCGAKMAPPEGETLARNPKNRSDPSDVQQQPSDATFASLLKKGGQGSTRPNNSLVTISSNLGLGLSAGGFLSAVGVSGIGSSAFFADTMEFEKLPSVGAYPSLSRLPSAVAVNDGQTTAAMAVAGTGTSPPDAGEGSPLSAGGPTGALVRDPSTNAVAVTLEEGVATGSATTGNTTNSSTYFGSSGGSGGAQAIARTSVLGGSTPAHINGVDLTPTASSTHLQRPRHNSTATTLSSLLSSPSFFYSNTVLRTPPNFCATGAGADPQQQQLHQLSSIFHMGGDGAAGGSFGGGAGGLSRNNSVSTNTPMVLLMHCAAVLIQCTARVFIARRRVLRHRLDPTTATATSAKNNNNNNRPSQPPPPVVEGVAESHTPDISDAQTTTESTNSATVSPAPAAEPVETMTIAVPVSALPAERAAVPAATTTTTATCGKSRRGKNAAASSAATTAALPTGIPRIVISFDTAWAWASQGHYSYSSGQAQVAGAVGGVEAAARHHHSHHPHDGKDEDETQPPSLVQEPTLLLSVLPPPLLTTARLLQAVRVLRRAGQGLAEAAPLTTDHAATATTISTTDQKKAQRLVVQQQQEQVAVRRHLAAAVIQTLLVRPWRARRRVGARSADYESTFRAEVFDSLLHEAAVTIQAAERGRQARKRLFTLQVVIVMQRYVRQFIARRRALASFSSIFMQCSSPSFKSPSPLPSDRGDSPSPTGMKKMNTIVKKSIVPVAAAVVTSDESQDDPQQIESDQQTTSTTPTTTPTAVSAVATANIPRPPISSSIVDAAAASAPIPTAGPMLTSTASFGVASSSSAAFPSSGVFSSSGSGSGSLYTLNRQRGANAAAGVGNGGGLRLGRSWLGRGHAYPTATAADSQSRLPPPSLVPLRAMSLPSGDNAKTTTTTSTRTRLRSLPQHTGGGGGDRLAHPSSTTTTTTASSSSSSSHHHQRGIISNNNNNNNNSGGGGRTATMDGVSICSSSSSPTVSRNAATDAGSPHAHSYSNGVPYPQNPHQSHNSHNRHPFTATSAHQHNHPISNDNDNGGSGGRNVRFQQQHHHQQQEHHHPPQQQQQQRRHTVSGSPLLPLTASPTLPC